VRRFATLSYILLLSGCVSNPAEIKTPNEIIGIVSNPQFTGWLKDLCNEGQVTKSLSGCAPHGVAVYEMEVYKVTIRQARMLGGGKISQDLVVGFASHALRKDYRERKRLYLQRAPDNFRDSTGIEYLAEARR
jgi:hypothetical protein